MDALLTLREEAPVSSSLQGHGEGGRQTARGREGPLGAQMASDLGTSRRWLSYRLAHNFVDKRSAAAMRISNHWPESATFGRIVVGCSAAVPPCSSAHNAVGLSLVWK